MARRGRRKGRRRGSSRRASIFGKKIPIISNPLFQKAAAGIGVATLGAGILALIAPSIAAQPIVRTGLALAGGGIPGVVAQLFLGGGLGGVGGLFGGGGGNGSAGAA